MVKLSQYISYQDSKFIESYELFIDTATKDQRKAEKFYDIPYLKDILQTIDKMLIVQGQY